MALSKSHILKNILAELYNCGLLSRWRVEYTSKLQPVLRYNFHSTIANFAITFKQSNLYFTKDHKTRWSIRATALLYNLTTYDAADDLRRQNFVRSRKGQRGKRLKTGFVKKTDPYFFDTSYFDRQRRYFFPQGFTPTLFLLLGKYPESKKPQWEFLSRFFEADIQTFDQLLAW